MAKFYYCNVQRGTENRPLSDNVTESTVCVLCDLDFPRLFSHYYHVLVLDEYFTFDRNHSLRRRRLSRRVVDHILQFDKLPFTKRL